MQKIGNITTTADANGEWTNGNVAAGTAPTIIDAAWLNTIQRELAGIVTGGGLALDPMNDAQVLAAIKKIFLQTANNLSEIKTAGAGAQASARTNLGLGNSATLNVGTTPGNLAAADDARIVGALQKNSNLADLPSATSSRANLGLGSAAVANVGTGGGMVPDMSSFTSGASGSASWQRLPSGMLLQYGYINTMSAGLSSVVYPVPFTTYLRSLTLTPTGNLGATSVNAVIPSLAPATGTPLTVFSASGYNIPSSGAPVAANILFYWEAIGV